MNGKLEWFTKTLSHTTIQNNQDIANVTRFKGGGGLGGGDGDRDGDGTGDGNDDERDGDGVAAAMTHFPLNIFKIFLSPGTHICQKCNFKKTDIKKLKYFCIEKWMAIS